MAQRKARQCISGYHHPIGNRGSEHKTGGLAIRKLAIALKAFTARYLTEFNSNRWAAFPTCPSQFPAPDKQGVQKANRSLATC